MEWKDLILKKNKGQEKIVCPSCSQDRKKKKEPCMAVYHEDGVAKCFHCEELIFRDKIEKKKEYESPPPNWSNYTKLPESAVKWFNSRGISQQTIIDTKVTFENYYQPSLEKNVDNIVFNYFERGELVNKKYRSGNKRFTQSKGAKKTFYGIDDIIGFDEVYIVEGEMDKISFWEIGIKNCISVPNGAKDSSIFEDSEKYFKDIKTFFIAVDMDEPGVELEKELVKRLGKHKCKRISFKGKDASDDLSDSKLTLEGSIADATFYPVDGTFTALDVKSELYELYENGNDPIIQPSDRYFKEFNKVFSQLPGQLTTVTGIPGHGKSNFVDWYVINLGKDNNKKVSWYSPEHFPMKQHHRSLSEKVIGKAFLGENRMSRAEVEKYIEWSKDKLYLTMPERADTPNWEWLFNRFEEQVYRFGIDIFVIDAFNKVKLIKGDLHEISSVLSRLTLFCQIHEVNVFLIAHPTKMKKDDDGKYNLPTLYDVKGSGDFYDQTHNGFTVYTNWGDDVYTSVITTKLKEKFQTGQVGLEAQFKFDMKSGRFYPRNKNWDTHSLLLEKSITLDENKQFIKTNEDENDDDCPF